MEQLVVIHNNTIYIHSASNNPIINDDDATTEDILISLGYDPEDVTYVWGEDFKIVKEE